MPNRLVVAGLLRPDDHRLILASQFGLKAVTDNRAVEPSEVVSKLWSQVQARDWIGVGALLAEDFVLEWPNGLVRLRGRANFVEFNRTYPEGWSIEVLR